MDDTVRVGIIGTGFGAHHIEVLRETPGAEVTAICSAKRSRADAIAARFGIPFATDDYHQIFDRVDAVVIASPPKLHAQMARDAISTGRHVFCEKPLAGTLAEAIAMRDAAEQAHIVHMINFQQRFMAHWSRTAEIIHSGTIGRLIMIDMRVTMNPIEYLASPGWSDSKASWFADAAQSGGLLASSVGPHLVDLVRWIGGPVIQVTGQTIVSRPTIPLPDGSEVRDIDAEDGFALLARYENGAILTIRGVPVVHREHDWDMELHGDEGSLIVDGSDLRFARVGDSRPEPIEQPQPVNPRIAIASRFLDAVRAGGPSPQPNFNDGVAAQALLDAAIQAARSGTWKQVQHA